MVALLFTVRPLCPECLESHYTNNTIIVVSQVEAFNVRFPEVDDVYSWDFIWKKADLAFMLLLKLTSMAIAYNICLGF